jgi:hypothetical protein
VPKQSTVPKPPVLHHPDQEIDTYLRYSTDDIFYVEASTVEGSSVSFFTETD